MPKGPKGEKRPADIVGAAVKTMKERVNARVATAITASRI